MNSCQWRRWVRPYSLLAKRFLSSRLIALSNRPRWPRSTISHNLPALVERHEGAAFIVTANGTYLGEVRRTMVTEFIRGSHRNLHRLGDISFHGEFPIEARANEHQKIWLKLNRRTFNVTQAAHRPFLKHNPIATGGLPPSHRSRCGKSFPVAKKMRYHFPDDLEHSLDCFTFSLAGQFCP